MPAENLPHFLANHSKKRNTYCGIFFENRESFVEQSRDFGHTLDADMWYGPARGGIHQKLPGWKRVFGKNTFTSR